MKYAGRLVAIISFLLTGCLPGQKETVLSPDLGTYQAWGIATDSSGNLFVADRGNHKIRKIDLTTNVVSDFAGSGTAGLANGQGTSAQLSYPSALAIDSSDNMYVANWDYGISYQSFIQKVSPSGAVTTFATLPLNSAGYIQGMAIRSNGDLVVATTYEIWNVDSSGNVTSLAGNGTQGDVDGNGSSARFYQIFDITVDPSDNIWIGTPAPVGWKIKKLDLAGNVTTEASVYAASAVSYYNGHILFNDGQFGISKFKISDASVTRIIDNAYVSNGGNALLASPGVGLFIDYDVDQLVRHGLP